MAPPSLHPQEARLLRLTAQLTHCKTEMERMWVKWQDMARLGLAGSLGAELLPEVRSGGPANDCSPVVDGSHQRFMNEISSD
jgi:hypothetical protein